jgi:hypothetical protein
LPVPSVALVVVPFDFVGAKGIRRRRVVRRLPPAPEDGVAQGAPPIMWPVDSSGFEADPFSPAGQAQNMWRFLDGVRSLRNRREAGPLRWLSWLVVILVAVPTLAAVVLGLVRLVLG